MQLSQGYDRMNSALEVSVLLVGYQGGFIPKSENQKQKLLYIAQYLMENTDETHAVSTPQLIEYLNSQGI